MNPYRGYMFYKLYRALQEAGIPEDGMGFTQNMTWVSEEGFFTISFKQKVPQVIHFLVWEEKRSWHNSFKLYRDLKRFLIMNGFLRFLAVLPKKESSFRKIFQFISGNKLEPHAEKEGYCSYEVELGRDVT